MKVLFLASAVNGTISPIVYNQGEALKETKTVELDYFGIYEKGLAGYIKSTRRLQSFLKKNNYDIIHAHYGLSGLIAGLVRSKPFLVVSYMGDDLIGINREDGSYTFAGHLIAWLDKLFAGYVNSYNIVKSDELKSKLKRISNVSVIPNGVDTDLFCEIDKQQARNKLNWPKKQKVIIFISDPLRPEKNFPLAQNALDTLKEYDVKLYPVNNISHYNLTLYYNAADCIIMTSFHEGSPNVIKEAMACNTPIVATDVGDVRKVIGNTEGCYVTGFEPGEVADKIGKALDFAALKGKTNGREQIMRLGFDSKSIAEKIVSVYQHITNRK